MFTIDKQELFNNTGINLDNVGIDNLFYYVARICKYLGTHNKNYTQEQYHKIMLLNDIIECITIE